MLVLVRTAYSNLVDLCVFLLCLPCQQEWENYNDVFKVALLRLMILVSRARGVGVPAQHHFFCIKPGKRAGFIYFFDRNFKRRMKKTCGRIRYSALNNVAHFVSLRDRGSTCHIIYSCVYGFKRQPWNLVRSGDLVRPDAVEC